MGYSSPSPDGLSDQQRWASSVPGYISHPLHLLYLVTNYNDTLCSVKTFLQLHARPALPDNEKMAMSLRHPSEHNLTRS